ncbi:hypothetical protein CRUP_016426 [Coryphaenoides rupestris]|nr:hypothetical protein CRUP_016426 [Coryphaenoides rupestris]
MHRGRDKIVTQMKDVVPLPLFYQMIHELNDHTCMQSAWTQHYVCGRPPVNTTFRMEPAVVEHIYLLVIVTLLSVIQNGSFAQKLEREGKCGCAVAFERVSCAVRNCMDAYPTFLAVMWCAGLCVSQTPAAFAGILYLVVRQNTPGFLFGKRVICFLVLMCIVGIFNYLLVRFVGSRYKEQVEILTSAASALLLIP